MNLGAFGTLDWEDWFYGLISAFIGGGANAVVAGIVVSATDPHGDYSPLNGRFYVLVGAVFFASGLLNMFSFLRTKPLPAHKTVVTTIETTQRQSTPPAVIVTKVEETHTEPMKPEEQKP